METASLIVTLAAVAGFASVLAVALPFIRRDRLGDRLKSIAARRQELNIRQLDDLQRRSRWRSKVHVTAMRKVLDRLRLGNLTQTREVRKRLSQAGWRHPSAAVTYVFSRISVPLLTTGLAFLYLNGPNIALPFGVKLLVITAALVIGYFLPALLVTNAVQKRQQALARALPDVLDLLVICVESGQSVEAAFARVMEELGESSPAVVEEIGLLSAELAFLGDRRQSYENFAERTGLPAIKSLATALVQAERYGTPVSLALRVIAQENRDTRFAAAEKKAAALPAKLTVPMIIFFLPVLFMVIAGPAVIQIGRMP